MDEIIIDSVATSNMSTREKSRVLSMLEQIMPKDKSPQTVLGMLVEGTVAGTTGALLGIAQAELKDGLDYNRKYPIDLTLGVIAKGAGKIYSSSISREVGNVAIGIYSYRNVEKLLTALKPKEEPVAAE